MDLLIIAISSVDPSRQRSDGFLVSILYYLGSEFKKICLFVRNCLVGTAPVYLQEFCVAISSNADLAVRAFDRRAEGILLSQERIQLDLGGADSLYHGRAICVEFSVQKKFENILHAKATLTPLSIHIKRA